MSEQRLIDRLTIYWNRLRGEEAVPDYAQFNPSAITDLWPKCVLFAIQPTAPGAPPALTFQMIGDEVRALYGAHLIGKSFTSAQRQAQGAAVVRKLSEAIAASSVITDAGQFISERQKIVKYRSCLLPFASKGVLSHVVAGLSWKEM